MRQGKVKWYNGKKCFGFISPDTANEQGNQDDVFVHSTALKAADIRFLNEGDTVEFSDEVRNGKLSVVELKLIKRDEESAKKFQERRSSFHDRDNRGGGYGERRSGGYDRPRRDNRDGDDKGAGWKFWKK